MDFVLDVYLHLCTEMLSSYAYVDSESDHTTNAASQKYLNTNSRIGKREMGPEIRM